MQHAPQRSTVNLFKLLNQRAAPTLADFLHDAAALPAGVTFDTDTPQPPDTKPNPNGLCGVNGSQSTTLLFNPDAATILNTRMPLALLADAAEDKNLPRNLSFQIAQSTWTRAVLLDQPEIAKRMSPILTGCYPSWKQWLDGYNSAAGTSDRRAAGLLALMRFPSNAPLVRAGIEREDGFAGYSMYRDNWWSGSDTAQPASSNNPSAGPPPSSARSPLAGAPSPIRLFSPQPTAPPRSARSPSCARRRARRTTSLPPRSTGRSSIQPTRAPWTSSASPSAPSATAAGRRPRRT